MKVVSKLVTLLLALAVMWAAGASAKAQSDDEASEPRDQDEVIEPRDQSSVAADAAKRLMNHDPLVRQHAAEELAKAAAPEWRNLVDGYRRQEDDSRVKLALDWALYRMGKTEALYAVVRALDSSRSAQAQSYLAQLDSPEALYIFLEPASEKAKVKLFEVLARIGDAGTIERIKPYAASFDQKVARAADSSMREINARLAQASPDAPTRPRRVGNNEEETSP